MIAPNAKGFVSVARRRWCDRGFVGGVRVDRGRRIGLVGCVGVRGGFAAAPVARHGGFQDVVDGDYPEELIVVVDDGQVEQVVIGRQQRYVDQVGSGCTRMGSESAMSRSGALGSAWSRVTRLAAPRSRWCLSRLKMVARASGLQGARGMDPRQGSGDCGVGQGEVIEYHQASSAGGVIAQ
jgi:hypothetical protein